MTIYFNQGKYTEMIFREQKKKLNYLIISSVGCGNSVEQSLTNRYNDIAKLKAPDLFYRIDIGQDTQEKLSKLRELKLIGGE